MATAEQYAEWIVANADKKGTPEFDTVAQAYKVAKGAAPVAAAPTAPVTKDVPIGDINPQVGAAETGAALASGALATPVAGLAGLGTAIAKAFNITDAKPEDIIQKVQAALTYQPESASAKGALNAIGFIPAKIADAADWAGDKVAKGAEAIGAPVEVAGAAGAATSAGLQVFGPSLAAKGVAAAGRATGDALKSGAQRAMQSALKPNQGELLKGKGEAAVQTLLDEGVNVSSGGVNALQAKIGELNTKIATAIQNSPATIDKSAVATKLNGLFDKFQKQVNPTSDLAVIQKAHDEFMAHPMLRGNQIPVQVAQEIKQGTYRALGGKSYGEMKGVEIEAQKALAAGIKEEIAKAIPDISPLNAQESKLLGALAPTERRVLMSANHNPVGLGWLTTDPVKFAGFMADRSNLFKSLIARMLNQTGELVPAATSAKMPAKAAAIMSESQQRRREAERE